MVSSSGLATTTSTLQPIPNYGVESTATNGRGDVELRIPKLRKGSFFPSILESRRRIDQALYAVGDGGLRQRVSNCSADNLMEVLGADSGIKESEVPRICAGLDEVVGAFRTRVDHIELP